MTTKTPLQKILQRILHTENKSIQNHERTGEKKGQKLVSNIDSAAHNQTLIPQRQLSDRNHQILINTNTECYQT
jgi:hypothetical protein